MMTSLRQWQLAPWVAATLCVWSAGAGRIISNQQCDDSDFNGTFDLVITWHTDAPQSPPATIAQMRHFANRLHHASSFVQAGSGIENQREILYLLRGAEKFGLLDHVGKVFVIVAKDELMTKGPPSDLNWDHPQLRLVSDDQIGITGMSGYTSKFASLHKIPGISKWILLLQDDVIPTGQWDPAGIYDFVQRRPLVRLEADSYVAGWCGEGPFKSPMGHGPWFVNSCHLMELEARYPDRFQQVRSAKSKKGTLALDMQCLYDNIAAREGWASPVKNTHFWTNCHINAGCKPATFLHPGTMFLNLQGPGVSDDYNSNSRIHEEALKFYHNYATPSRFEKLGSLAQALIRSKNGSSSSTIPISGATSSRRSLNSDVPEV